MRTDTTGADFPDELRLARYARSPERGPKLLFFSGGSALAAASRELINYTHNSIHLITPFDSGGSSATLRAAFGMPAVGDIRNRLMALADPSAEGAHDIYTLFAYRLPSDGSPELLTKRLDAMIAGDDPLVSAVAEPMRENIKSHLRFFREAAPPAFTLAGASIGNLILTGGYLHHGRRLDPVIDLFAKLVAARGVVRPVVNADLTLTAVGVDGGVVAGQSRITAGETGPIVDLFVAKNDQRHERVSIPLHDNIRNLIAEAELICFSMGSFYSSIIATLLPEGIAEAICANDRPKIFVPNTGVDPEQEGKRVTDLVTELNARIGGSLDAILVDTAGACYPGGVDRNDFEAMKVDVVDVPLVGEAGPSLDPERLCQALLSLV